MVHVELDSFYVKFKHLLRAEKDATLTLKSEAGRAFVTLTLDLGHVLSEQDLRPHGGSSNGPARIRRREKRAAARENLATEEAKIKVEPTANVEATRTTDKPVAVEAIGNVKATDNVANTENGEEPKNAEEAEERATKAKEEEEATAGKVEAIEDEFCTDDVYLNLETKKTKSVETQTLERGPLPNTPSKPGFDYYTLRYDDLSD
jgi:hypothetical protein